MSDIPETDLEAYIDSHIEPEPPQLRAVRRRTHLLTAYPHMCSGHAQGRLLRALTAMARPQVALEIGAFTGYSTLCIAEGLPPGSVLHTIEADEEIVPMLQTHIASSPRAADITLHCGDALEVLKKLHLTVDLAFIDANKRYYSHYLRALLPLMRPGGFIIADNTLWGGKVADPGADDAQTRGIREFNDLVTAHPRLRTCLIPLRDGLTLMQVLPRENAQTPPIS